MKDILKVLKDIINDAIVFRYVSQVSHLIITPIYIATKVIILPIKKEKIKFVLPLKTTVFRPINLQLNFSGVGNIFYLAIPESRHRHT